MIIKLLLLMGILHFETFLLTGILLNITPGNDTIFILTQSLAQGRKAGIIAALGISTGSLVHTLMAAFGLSIIIANSMLLFNVIKYSGALYLLYMGLKMLFNKEHFETTLQQAEKKASYQKIYRDAIITNVLNPKVALFFISFLPQFIDNQVQNTILPFTILGFTFIFTGTIWCLILAFFASFLFNRLQSQPSLSKYIYKICGLVLVSLSIKVAFAQR